MPASSLLVQHGAALGHDHTESTDREASAFDANRTPARGLICFGGPQCETAKPDDFGAIALESRALAVGETARNRRTGAKNTN